MYSVRIRNMMLLLKIKVFMNLLIYEIAYNTGEFFKDLSQVQK